VGTSKSHNPMGLHGLVKGYLYFFYVAHKAEKFFVTERLVTSKEAFDLVTVSFHLASPTFF
jgi:hypothetical protein